MESPTWAWPEHKSPTGVTNNARPVNQNDLDNFHAEYGFKLSPQLDDAQRYEILEMLVEINCQFWTTSASGTPPFRRPS